MDKNRIKSFAIWARRNLISAVTERAKRIGVTENKIEEAVAVQGGFKLEDNDEIFKLSKSDRDKLKNEVKEKGFEQVMEEVAYTWFNRFMGLRYMEVNDYLPSGIRVLSSEVDGKTEPDVLTRVSEVIDELKLNSEDIYELLDSGKTEDREEAYKNILVRQCNELGKIIPQMFEKISDYTELLLPDNLLEEGSVIRKMVEDIEEDDWKEEVEIIGWMYQYYISEKKDEVFAALKKNVKITKENIPAATQLFTPKWIVKYMVENSLGRLWLEGHPNEELQKEWKYYLEEAEQEPEVEEELKKIREEHSQLKPEDIKVLDPCMGSGHILVYAFDLLYEIYKTAGYSEREIPRMILQNNLYGLDIDDRAAQLASFALIMKARHYNRRLFREIEREYIELNLYAIQDSSGISEESIDYLAGGDKDLKGDVKYLIDLFKNAKECASIINVKCLDFEKIDKRILEIRESDTNISLGDTIEAIQIDAFSYEYKEVILNKIFKLIKQARIMNMTYEICITNPPYMGRKGMDENLKSYIDKNYPISKNDLFSIFIDKYTNKENVKYYSAFISMQSWLFLGSYESLREKLLNNNSFINLLQIGYNSFPGMNSQIAHATTFILYNQYLKQYKSKYIDLNANESITANKKEVFFKRLKSNSNYVKKQTDYLNIPGKNIAYWISNKVKEVFNSYKSIAEFTTTASQNVTGNNDKYLRFHWELYNDDIGNTKRWRFYAKGGGYRKWYGNLLDVIDWSPSAREAYRTGHASQIIPEEFWYKKGITWGLITTSTPSFRILPNTATFDKGGSSIFVDDERLYDMTLGFLNSKVALNLLNIFNTTINYQVRDIRNLPFNLGSEINNKTRDIVARVNKCVEITKNDWDSFETSWDFKVHPLLKLLDKDEKNNLSSIFRIWGTKCEGTFEQLKHSEEELNRIFIDIYGLKEELTAEVGDKEITIRKADRERDIKSFISYAVGCMFGRYSIDAEGLIYAGGEFRNKWLVDSEQCKVRKIEKDEDGDIISDSWVEATFVPDRDNVIPITEDEYFEDDIVSRFIDFVRTVYSNETLEENLDFIADSIGRKPSETARQAIRRYFIKDFYKDHLKVYLKRPIYWMFESGKNDGFKALVYMHRYNEQTVAKVRTDYLHTLQRKYEAEIERQQLIVDSEEYTAKDRTAAKKKIDRISKQIEECREYDQVVAHLANEKISIDLDDGVKVNYEKFQGANVINSKGKEVKMDLLAKI